MTETPNPLLLTRSGADEDSVPGLPIESVQIHSLEKDGSLEASDSESGLTPSEPQSKGSSSSPQLTPYPGQAPSQEEGAAVQAQWHAIWSPAHGAYYFYNPSTTETTWVNPLAPGQPVTEEITQGTPGHVSGSFIVITDTCYGAVCAALSFIYPKLLKTRVIHPPLNPHHPNIIHPLGLSP